MVAPSALVEVLNGVRELERIWSERRLDAIEWLPHQARLLRDTRLIRLLRTGNQLGKTEVGLAEVAFAAMGEHPFRKPTYASGEYWVICAGWTQSVAIQMKLWAVVPRDRFAPGTTCNRERGFGGRSPSCKLKHADGTWSIIKFRTTGQETLDLAGATIDGALFDEPPKSLTTFAEVRARTQASGGWILMTLTPIGADVQWLRDMVRKGAVSETHARLEPRALVPEGRTEPIRVRNRRGELYRWDAEWIERQVDLTPESEVDIRIHGDWDLRAVDAYFNRVWTPAKLVVTLDEIEAEREEAEREAEVYRAQGERLRALGQLSGPLDEIGGVIAHVGIDHGHRPGKQYACLFEIDDSDLASPFVDLVDEYEDDLGLVDPARDAAGILAMVERNGWSWDELTFVGGDRVHMPGTGEQKSNRDLEIALRKILANRGDLRRGRELHPRIRTVKRGPGRGKGSVVLGCRWIHRAMSDERFRIASHCHRAQDAALRFRLRHVDDEHKDVVDAWRYGLDPFIFYSPAAPGSGTAVRFA